MIFGKSFILFVVVYTIMAHSILSEPKYEPSWSGDYYTLTDYMEDNHE